MTSGPDEALWFTEENANRIGRLTTAGAFHEFQIPIINGVPVSITSGPDGALWFVEDVGSTDSYIVRITTAGSFTSYHVPNANPGVIGIITGPDGAIWFAEQEARRIGRMTIAGAFKEYSVAASPWGLTTGPDGAIWFGNNDCGTKSGTCSVGRITTAGATSEFLYPVCCVGIYDITTGSDGNLWFTTSGPTAAIGRISVPGLLSTMTTSGVRSTRLR